MTKEEYKPFVRNSCYSCGLLLTEEERIVDFQVTINFQIPTFNSTNNDLFATPKGCNSGFYGILCFYNEVLREKYGGWYLL